jgi:hypothetical protein
MACSGTALPFRKQWVVLTMCFVRMYWFVPSTVVLNRSRPAQTAIHHYSYINHSDLLCPRSHVVVAGYLPTANDSLFYFSGHHSTFPSCVVHPRSCNPFPPLIFLWLFVLLSFCPFSVVFLVPSITMLAACPYVSLPFGVCTHEQVKNIALYFTWKRFHLDISIKHRCVEQTPDSFQIVLWIAWSTVLDLLRLRFVRKNWKCIYSADSKLTIRFCGRRSKYRDLFWRHCAVLE